MNMAGGDNDGDDKSAAPLWDGADRTTWEPDSWHQSPDAMAAKERAMNQACFAHAAAQAHKHDNAPNDPNLRPF